MAYTYDKQPSSYTTGITTIFVPGASAQTGTFGSQTRHIRIANGSTLCWIKIGANPTATATDGILMPANCIDYQMVNPGQVAAVFGTAGNCSITECS
jgi:hypothetical protein